MKRLNQHMLFLLILAVMTACVPTEMATTPAVSSETNQTPTPFATATGMAVSITAEGTPTPCPEAGEIAVVTRVVVEVVTGGEESELPTPSPTTTPTQELPVMDMATVMARPAYVEDTTPDEYSIVPLTLYQYEPECYTIWGGGNVQEGFHSTICIAIDIEPLAQPGDNLVSPEVQTRMTLLVDGNPMEWGDYVVHALLSERIEPDGTRTTFAPPHAPCWLVPVGVGRHEATFQFRQTSGDVQVYTWYFEIVE